MLLFLILFSIPIYSFCIWGIKDPEEVYLLFEEWRYKEFPKFSDVQITLQKIGYVIVIIGWTILLILLPLIPLRPTHLHHLYPMC